MSVRVQRQDFDFGEEIRRLTSARTDIGAVATFLGLVRDDAQKLSALTLEHYPGMTERQLAAIEAAARRRWSLIDVAIIHRFGRLLSGAQIVMVAVAANHRLAAFEACEFLMDWLKTRAPFWKLEEGPGGCHWVEPKNEDDQRAERWTILPEGSRHV
ncbi:MAG TPA: molybdenum cofactor biosynthesis protein MoaE [Rhodospirillaceae bacterium]|nr:molybdenum cofactor biosynthesis protein MoaE [Rhodospirillaceae bacterium]